jgi:hypothetical protein
VSYRVAVSLGGRPIDVSIHDRARTTIAVRPEVRTGDAAFDAVYLVNGYPSEVIVAALDAARRQTIAQSFGGQDPNVGVTDGELRWSPGRVSSLTASDIAIWVERTVNFAGALTSAFDGHRAAIAAAQGPAAADAWVHQQMQLAQRMADLRVRRAVKIFAILGLSIGLIVVVALLIAFL